MSDTVITVENLSKSYWIKHQLAGGRQTGGQYERFSEVLSRALAAPFRRRRKAGELDASREEFWALKDISFEVKRGEVLGIIGRNGAGKSTLLKILSRITEPTSGRIELDGRVASLLEVGTGFHPELTGRENVFLNGAILGMSRVEIKKKFDEIVAFAEVEKFLDTPVKRYSSGMYVRLAFAVAAHLEPEILIVDEVLAVGDVQFQKKCLGKMQEVSQKGGRTVLFVSHNIFAVQQLCQKCAVLNGGFLRFLGPVNEALSYYMEEINAAKKISLELRSDRTGNQAVKFTRVSLRDSQGNEIKQIISGQDVVFRLHYELGRQIPGKNIIVSFTIKSDKGYQIANLNSFDSGWDRLSLTAGGHFQCTWNSFNLRSGTYDCSLFCSVNGEITDWVMDAFTLHVEDGDFYKTGRMIGREQGDVLIKHSWESGGQAAGRNLPKPE